MNKQELFDAFDGKISKTAIQLLNDEYQIVGKFCRITFLDYGNGVYAWDVWICNHKDIAKGLGQSKVHNIVSSLTGIPRNQISLDNPLVNGPHTVLNGEAVVWVGSTEIILKNLSLLGIRKKTQYSKEQLERMRERARAFNKVQI